MSVGLAGVFGLLGDPLHIKLGEGGRPQLNLRDRKGQVRVRACTEETDDTAYSTLGCLPVPHGRKGQLRGNDLYLRETSRTGKDSLRRAHEGIRRIEDARTTNCTLCMQRTHSRLGDKRYIWLCLSEPSISAKSIKRKAFCSFL